MEVQTVVVIGAGTMGRGIAYAAVAGCYRTHDLEVPDPDAMFAKAVAAGAREVVAVKEACGWRLGRVVDPFGHHREIGHPLAA